MRFSPNSGSGSRLRVSHRLEGRHQVPTMESRQQFVDIKSPPHLAPNRFTSTVVNSVHIPQVRKEPHTRPPATWSAHPPASPAPSIRPLLSQQPGGASHLSQGHRLLGGRSHRGRQEAHFALRWPPALSPHRVGAPAGCPCHWHHWTPCCAETTHALLVRRLWDSP